MRHVLVSGDAFFLERHRLLLEALRAYARVTTLSAPARSGRDVLPLARFVARTLSSGHLHAFDLVRPRRLLRAYRKSAESFTSRSRALERNVLALRTRPDAVLHIFGLSTPFPTRRGIPYAHLIDYTYALALRNNPAEIPIRDEREVARWMTLERAAYAGAVRLYAMSRVVRDSLIVDYGVSPERIRVVGAGSNLDGDANLVEKRFGSGMLLFNASDFERKGGDLVLDAFGRMRAAHPTLRLVTVGRSLPRGIAIPAGVQDRGAVPRSEMTSLFANADLVLAPARCDPFPGFVVEASAFGTPSIVSDRDGMPEIVRDGETGIVLHRPTAESIASAASALLLDGARLARYSDGCRRVVAERLNWKAVASEFAPFIASLESRA